jgi:hypothetical protein
LWLKTVPLTATRTVSTGGAGLAMLHLRCWVPTQLPSWTPQSRRSSVGAASRSAGDWRQSPPRRHVDRPCSLRRDVRRAAVRGAARSPRACSSLTNDGRRLVAVTTWPGSTSELSPPTSQVGGYRLPRGPLASSACRSHGRVAGGSGGIAASRGWLLRQAQCSSRGRTPLLLRRAVHVAAAGARPHRSVRGRFRPHRKPADVTRAVGRVVESPGFRCRLRRG